MDAVWQYRVNAPRIRCRHLDWHVIKDFSGFIRHQTSTSNVNLTCVSDLELAAKRVSKPGLLKSEQSSWLATFTVINADALRVTSIIFPSNHASNAIAMRLLAPREMARPISPGLIPNSMAQSQE